MTLNVSQFKVTKKKLTISVQSVPQSRESTPERTPHAPNSESILEPELADFCAHLDITPNIREFHNALKHSKQQAPLY